MSDGAERLGHSDLGVDNTGVGGSATLYADGDVTIQNDHGEGLVLEREHVRALFAFLKANEEVEA